MLSRDAFSIVIKYLEPFKLKNFFLENKLDVRMKFVYDGFGRGKWVMRFDELCVILDMFPNMVLIGMIIEMIEYESYVYSYVNRLDRLLCCGIYNTNCANMMGLGDSWYLLKRISDVVNVVIWHVVNLHQSVVRKYFGGLRCLTYREKKWLEICIYRVYLDILN